MWNDKFVFRYILGAITGATTKININPYRNAVYLFFGLGSGFVPG